VKNKNKSKRGQEVNTDPSIEGGEAGEVADHAHVDLLVGHPHCCSHNLLCDSKKDSNKQGSND